MRKFLICSILLLGLSSQLNCKNRNPIKTSINSLSFENQPSLEDLREHYELNIHLTKLDTPSFFKTECNIGNEKMCIKLAALFKKEEKLSKAEKIYERSCENLNASACFKLSKLLRDQERTEEANQYYNMGTKIEDINKALRLAEKFEKKAKESEKKDKPEKEAKRYREKAEYYREETVKFYNNFLKKFYSQLSHKKQIIQTHNPAKNFFYTQKFRSNNKTEY